MTTHIEIDGDYCWALEVLTCSELDSHETPADDQYRAARRIIEQVGMESPMERL